jgi:alpha-tubulin suppressor-like RCC1 family protein
MGVVIILSLVVVGVITTTSSDPAGIFSSNSKLLSGSSQALRVVDAAGDQNGNFLVILRNNTGEAFTLKGITLCSEQVSEDKLLFNGDQIALELLGTRTNCPCLAERGKTQIFNIDFNILTQSRLEKIITIEQAIECVADAKTNFLTCVDGCEVQFADINAPLVELLSPTDLFSTESTTAQFQFHATDDQNIKDCNLLIDGIVSGEITSIDLNEYTGTFNISSLSMGLHEWNVSCEDYSRNAGQAQNNLNFEVTAPTDTQSPTVALLSPQEGFISDEKSVTFFFNAKDNNSIKDCNILIDDNATVQLVSINQNDSNFTQTVTLDYGAHAWNVTCIDYNNNSNFISADYNLTVRFVPPQYVALSGISKYSVGSSSVAAITLDGNAYIWGRNTNNRLSLAANTTRAFPQKVDSLQNFQTIAAPVGDFGCGIKDNSVYCWGVNTNGQLGDGTTTAHISPTIVPGLTNAQDVGVGYDYSCALTNGDVYCWGSNAYGQLGDGTNTQRTSPTKITTLSGISELKVFYGHACALKSGELYCWGKNNYGNLGDGNSIYRNYPVKFGTLNNVSEFSSTNETGCAIQDGNVYCSGSSQYGTIGGCRFGVSGMYSPLQVKGISNATKLAGGNSHMCAISDGDVYCWGGNTVQQSSQLNLPNYAMPSKISGLPNPVDDIFSSSMINTTCASANGNIYCWGDNGLNTFNDPNASYLSTPSLIPSLKDYNLTSINCGMKGTNYYCWGDNGGFLGTGIANFSTTAILMARLGPSPLINRNCYVFDGKMYCRGMNMNGTNGNCSLSSSSPYMNYELQTVLDINNVVKASVNHSGACAITGEGKAYCWGENSRGQLGASVLGSTISIPVEITSLPNISLATMGQYHGCVVSDGNVYCIGQNDYGQVGNGTTTNRTTLTRAGTITNVTAIEAGTHSTCAISSGNVYCWGWNNYGQLGDGTTTNRSTPTKINSLSNVTKISISGYVNCALSGGKVYCWGHNVYGAVGDGTTTSRSSPVQVPGITNAIDISTGSYYTACAVVTGGKAYCWGINSSGELGDGTTTQRTTPVEVTVMDDIQDIETTAQQGTCAVNSAGDYYCWGSDTTGQLGYDYMGANLGTKVPQQLLSITGTNPIKSNIRGGGVIIDGNLYVWGYNMSKQVYGLALGTVNMPIKYGTLTGVTDFAVGMSNYCALSGGKVYCSGSGSSGQMGNGTTTSTNAPAVQVNTLTNATSVTIGYSHICALNSGTVYCWGQNTYGQIGDNTVVNKTTPTAAQGLSGVTSVVNGAYHSCAIKNGDVYCWGQNSTGQIGNGTYTNALIPVKINGVSNVTALALGSGYTCAVSDGNVYCWGQNTYGDIGIGVDTNQTNTPTLVPNINNVTTIYTTVWGSGNCAVTQNNEKYCWGVNYGAGRISWSSTAVKVTN